MQVQPPESPDDPRYRILKKLRKLSKRHTFTIRQRTVKVPWMKSGTTEQVAVRKFLGTVVGDTGIVIVKFSDGYSVTHLASGKRIGQCLYEDKERAVLLAVRLAQWDIDWTLPENKVIDEATKQNMILDIRALANDPFYELDRDRKIYNARPKTSKQQGRKPGKSTRKR